MMQKQTILLTFLPQKIVKVMSMNELCKYASCRSTIKINIFLKKTVH